MSSSFLRDLVGLIFKIDVSGDISQTEIFVVVGGILFICIALYHVIWRFIFYNGFNKYANKVRFWTALIIIFLAAIFLTAYLTYILIAKIVFSISVISIIYSLFGSSKEKTS